MSSDALQWLLYVSRTRNNVVQAGNVWKVYLDGVRCVKFGGYRANTKDVFQYLGRFFMGVFAYPIDTNDR